MARSAISMVLVTGLSFVALASCSGEPAGSGERQVQPPTAPDCSCPAAAASSVHLPLACRCPDNVKVDGCPATMADIDLQAACARGETATRREGCGRVVPEHQGEGSIAFVGGFRVFDAVTQRLVGAYDYSDVPHGGCQVFAYVYGQGLFPPEASVAGPMDACPQITMCWVCGPNPRGLPTCK
jgi:hypothetical protein